ncbi:PREDICTED: aminoacylase-1-like [Papilio polytes]|uniref:aminoacylase-1-like n=1 Tax=Papilio polytes TaxID=76194 RepID=UPI0006761460|nr:PREDICTED: aminoacylase-1-like [Papilio polytes]
MNIKILLWFCFVHVHISIATLPCQEYICTREVETLRDYISFRTTRKDDFKKAVDFFKRLAARQGVEVTVFEAKPNYPIVIIKWPGQDPTLKSIVLLSHIDVNSACYEDGWDYPPFSGEINENCEIIGRGTQAQKTLTIQHYEALRQLKQNNVTLLRTVYIVATSDQTTGSRDGIELFVKTKTFQNMNVGFTLGVGAPSVEPEIFLFNRFKTNYVIRLDCYGQSASSAILPSYNDTAASSCGYVLQAYNRYREEQYRLSLRTRDAGDYTVINFLGGRNIIEYDVIPAHFAAYYAANLALNTTVEDFIELVRGWILAAGGNITVSSIYKEEGGNYFSKTDDSNPYYVAIEQAFEELNIPFQLLTTPSTTDTTFVVKAGIPAFGLTPIRNTQVLVNGVNERLPLRIYLEGLRILKEIISRLANIPDDKVTDDPTDYLEKCNK